MFKQTFKKLPGLAAVVALALAPAGFVLANHHDDDEEPYGVMPSHWMPLPKAPEDKQ